jgi:hypothetical protein
MGSLGPSLSETNGATPGVTYGLGHLALLRGGPDRRLAVIGLVLGYLAILTLVGTVIGLTLAIRA